VPSLGQLVLRLHCQLVQRATAPLDRLEEDLQLGDSRVEVEVEVAAVVVVEEAVEEAVEEVEEVAHQEGRLQQLQHQ
jgi:hypothetical protein